MPRSVKNPPFEIYEDPEDSEFLEESDSVEEESDSVDEDSDNYEDVEDSEDEEIEETQDLINAYLWEVVNLDAPAWYICPAYNMILGNEDDFEEISRQTPLSFPPNLPAVLNSPTPPSVSFFRTLPKPAKGQKVFAVYKVLMEKIGQRPRVYTGSGTNSTAGARVRMGHYASLTNLPRFVKAALDDGFTITNVGMICWSDIPAAQFVPKCQLRFLGLEATFSYLFFTGIPAITDSIWTKAVPWKRNQVEWDPLCGHTSLNERPNNLHLTDEQLVAYDKIRKENRRLAFHNSVAKAKSVDAKGYLARKASDKLSWTNKNRDKVHDQAKGVRQRAKDSGKHRCETCQKNLASATSLKKHLNSKAHKEEVRLAASGKPKPVSAETARSRKWFQARKENRPFPCAICNKAFAVKPHYEKHLKSAKHQKLAARAAAASV